DHKPDGDPHKDEILFCAFTRATPRKGGERSVMAPETIGFIGLGVMGKPMAKNLIKAGHQLVVHSRTRASVDEVVAAGAAAAVSPADVARRTTMVITMLPDTADVELVLTGPDGVLPALQPRAIV